MKNILVILSSIIMSFYQLSISYAEPTNYKTAMEYWQLGITKVRNHDYTGAISDFNKSIELDAKLAAPYYERGLVVMCKIILVP